MRRLVAFAVVLVPSLMLGYPTGATAGTYQVVACSQASNAANNSWQPFNSDPSHLSTGQACPPQPGSGEPPKSTGMFATDTLGSSTAAPDGAIAGWRFITPPGTSIVALQDDRYIGAYADNGWMPFVKADSTVLETCAFTMAEEGCSVGAPFGSGSLNGTLQVGEVETLTVGVKCTIPGGCTTGALLHRAWAALYGAKVTLNTQAPPAIATPTGPLWGSGSAGGFHKGVEQVGFAASDLTGIAKATVSVDGHVMATHQGTCDYTQPLPCQSLSPTFQVDTTQLTDGAHTVVLNAYDAAGNEAQLTEQIVVANQPPPPPVGLKAAAQSGGSFVVSWSDPTHAAPIVGATYQLCPSSRVGCSAPTPTGHDSPITLPANVAGQTVRVWLTDAAGNSSPANAASVILTAPGSSTTVLLPEVRHQRLRVRHTLRGRRLTVVALAPAGVEGPIKFSVVALRGRTRLARISRRAKVKRGRAEVVFVLSRAALSAGRLSIDASAQGAASAAVVVVLHRRSSRRALPR
jgi:hypothetical protein